MNKYKKIQSVQEDEKQLREVRAGVRKIFIIMVMLCFSFACFCKAIASDELTSEDVITDHKAQVVGLLPDGTDLNRLSWAVSMHETKNCEEVTNFTVKNNCHGFKWNGRIYEFYKRYDSHVYFKDLWTRKYGKFPDEHLARIYSGKDRSEAWLVNVTYFYNNYEKQLTFK